MGKLDVAILRYLTGEDFRVLTAVSNSQGVLNYLDFSNLKLIYLFNIVCYVGGNGYEKSRVSARFPGRIDSKFTPRRCPQIDERTL